MKTSLQCVTMPADKRPMFVCRDASGIVTFRNPEGVYPRLFKVAPIRFNKTITRGFLYKSFLWFIFSYNYTDFCLAACIAAPSIA